MNIKNKVRKMVGVVSASVMIMMMLGVVYADGVSEPRSYYCLRVGGDTQQNFIKCNGSKEFLLPREVNKSKVTSVHIDEGDGYTSIGNYAFSGCSELRSIKIPATVESIGEESFCGCSELTGIAIPEKVSNIGDGAFYGCKGLTSIAIPGNVNTISKAAFSYCLGLTSVDIPYGVTTIMNYAFEGCSGLTSVKLPANLKSIGNYAFNDCSGLTSVDIPYGVTTIMDCAFEGCSGLTSITIPGNIKNIARNSFTKCPLNRVELTGTHNDEISNELMEAFEDYTEPGPSVVSRNENWKDKPFGKKVIGYIGEEPARRKEGEGRRLGHKPISHEVVQPSMFDIVEGVFKNYSKLTKCNRSKSPFCMSEFITLLMRVCVSDTSVEKLERGMHQIRSKKFNKPIIDSEPCFKWIGEKTENGNIGVEKLKKLLKFMHTFVLGRNGGTNGLFDKTNLEKARKELGIVPANIDWNEALIKSKTRKEQGSCVGTTWSHMFEPSF